MTVILAIVAGLALGGVMQEADTPPSVVGMTACPDLPPEPESVRTFNAAFIRPGPVDMPAMIALTQQADFVAFGEAKAAREARDWPGLCVYRAENATLAASGHRPDIVFLGDSITENWARADPAFLDGRSIAGRGIGGQTSAQMLARFRADVIALHPRKVHIMAGTNDVAGNGGPTSPEAYEDNIRSMVDLARANGIEPVLASLPPADRFFWRPDVHPAERIVALNAWLRRFAAENGLRFIDYHSALRNDEDGMRAEYAIDGVHPNTDAYAIMRSLAEAGLR